MHIATRHQGFCLGLCAALILLAAASSAYPEPVDWSEERSLFLPHSPLYAFAEETMQKTADTENPMQGNRLMLIDDGDAALLVRVHLIRAARRSIDIQTFILADDECGRLIMYELIQAAKRGVRVRLLADHFMSGQSPQKVAFWATAHPNLELRYYRPPIRNISPGWPQRIVHGIIFARGVNQRMHNKLMVVDNIIALTGGRNIDNHYYNRSTTYNFIDRDALITGPQLSAMSRSFDDFWGFRHAVPAVLLHDVRAVLRREDYLSPVRRADFAFDDLFESLDDRVSDATLMSRLFIEPMIPARQVQFLHDRPGKNRMLGPLGFWGSGRVTRRLRTLFRESEESLVIQSPYLVVGFRMKRAMQKMRRENPEATIAVSTNSFASTDNILAYSGNYKFRSQYIDRLGFHIYEMKPEPPDLREILPNYDLLHERALEKQKQGQQDRVPYVSIHAKSIVFDDQIAFVGTYNIDPRSDNLNSEVGLLIHDEHIALDLKRRILDRTRPENSWIIARRQRALPVDEVNRLIENISGLTPLDVWPFRNTSSFELIEGREPVPPDHEDFYENYRDVGSFPGSEGVGAREILTRAYKILGAITMPML